MPIAGCCRWGCNLAEEATGSDLEIGAANQLRGSVDTLRSINNDRCEISRLSKIAHIRAGLRPDQNCGTFPEITELVLERALPVRPDSAGPWASGNSNSRPQSKHTLYVRCLMVNTRLIWRCRQPKINCRNPGSFINPARAAAVRNCR